MKKTGYFSTSCNKSNADWSYPLPRKGFVEAIKNNTILVLGACTRISSPSPKCKYKGFGVTLQVTTDDPNAFHSDNHLRIRDTSQTSLSLVHLEIFSFL